MVLSLSSVSPKLSEVVIFSEFSEFPDLSESSDKDLSVELSFKEDVGNEAKEADREALIAHEDADEDVDVASETSLPRKVETSQAASSVTEELMETDNRGEWSRDLPPSAVGCDT